MTLTQAEIGRLRDGAVNADDPEIEAMRAAWFRYQRIRIEAMVREVERVLQEIAR
jgi:hypothetical protein